MFFKLMHHILLLTDNPDFALTVQQPSSIWAIDFEYLILDSNTDKAHHASINDYQRIREACNGKDFVVFQIGGNKAIYVMDMLLAEKKMSGCHLIIMESPLIGFYSRQGEEFFVSLAIRQKLKKQALSYSFIRPLTSYYISQSMINMINRKSDTFWPLPDYKVLNWLFAEIDKGEIKGDIRYVLPELSFSSSRELSSVQKWTSYFVVAITKIKLLRNNKFCRVWLLKEALSNLFRHTESFRHKVLFPLYDAADYKRN